ncbi:MAG: nucleoside phosphorylase [archaeon]
MAYPKFADKHNEEQLITAGEFLKWKKLSKANAPKKYVFVYYSYILKYLRRKLHLHKVACINRLLTIYERNGVGVLCMTGIGAPHATTCMEEIIALGGRTFLNIGAAGGLHDFGAYLCRRALRDEGTSYHYIAHGDYTFPDAQLTKQFGTFLTKNEFAFKKGTTWTIDAPYKETKAEIHRYKRQGIDTVDMEASALFAVAKVRKVKIASAFVVSDVVGKEQWDPQFDKGHVRQQLKTLAELAVKFLH